MSPSSQMWLLPEAHDNHKREMAVTLPSQNTSAVFNTLIGSSGKLGTYYLDIGCSALPCIPQMAHFPEKLKIHNAETIFVFHRFQRHGILLY